MSRLFHQLLMLFLFANCFAQNSGQGPQNDTISDYQKLLDLNMKKIKTNNYDGNDLYNIAVYHFHLKHHRDTVFNYLFKSFDYDPILECKIFFEMNYSLAEKVGGNYHPKRFKDLKCFCDSAINRFDKSLRIVLEVMYKNDQKYREHSYDSPSVAGNEQKWIEQKAIDAFNLNIIDSLIKKQGYPGRTKVGSDLSDVAFYIILHSNDKAVLNKYLPIITQAVKEKQIEKRLYPLFYDRYAMLNDMPQKFGTQIIYNRKTKRKEPYKIKDLSKVNEYRKEYDLDNLATFLKKEDAYMPNE